MPWPTNPANGAFHRQDGVLYIAEGGKWNRAGAKGLDFRAKAHYKLNSAGPMKCRFPRLPHKKIVMDAVWQTGTVTKVRIQIWGVNDQPIDFNGKVDDYHIWAHWGDGGISVNNTAITSQPANVNGIIAQYGDDSHRANSDAQHIRVEFTEHVGGYINMEWQMLVTNGFNTCIQTIGEAIVHTNLKSIQSVGLTWDGNPTIIKAAAHTQWF